MPDNTPYRLPQAPGPPMLIVRLGSPVLIPCILCFHIITYKKIITILKNIFTWICIHMSFITFHKSGNSLKYSLWAFMYFCRLMITPLFSFVIPPNSFSPAILPIKSITELSCLFYMVLSFVTPIVTFSPLIFHSLVKPPICPSWIVSARVSCLMESAFPVMISAIVSLLST